MNLTKKINVNFSSLVGLKAELLRKQAEVNNAKVRTESTNVLPHLNKKRSKRVITEDVENRKNRKELTDSDDIIAHKKSKLMLEAKTRLYEKLKKSKNNDDKFLVDFNSKPDDPDEEIVDETIYEEYPIEPEENWVEYQDCFGRTRKCLREDLQHMQKKDDLIKQEIMKRNANEMREEDDEQYSATQKEPEIEIMRRKWEEQTQKLADKTDIHYQDILFDEARTHGVGYYAFSQDEEERTKQQENLANLRKETEKRQKETKETKELKERMEQNRLKAARIRQRVRAGLPAEPTAEELAQENGLNSISTATATEESAQPAKDDECIKEIPDKSIILEESNITNEKKIDEDKIKAFGELLGKKNHWHIMSQEEWVHKCRAQRVNEFAPVYGNFISTGFYNNSQNTNEQLTHENEEKFDSKESHPSQETVEESSTNLKNREVDNDTTNESVSYLDMDSKQHRESNKKILTEYNTVSNNSEVPKPSENVTESMLNSVKNPSISSREATVSYPLSHLSNNPSQNTYGYLKAYVSEQHKLLGDVSTVLNENNAISTASNDNSICISKQETLPRNINEDSIMAGLKYLREKFEENHNK